MSGIELPGQLKRYIHIWKWILKFVPPYFHSGRTMCVVPPLLVNLIFLCDPYDFTKFLFFAERDLDTFPSEVPTKKLGIHSTKNPDPRPRLLPWQKKTDPSESKNACLGLRRRFKANCIYHTN